MPETMDEQSKLRKSRQEHNGRFSIVYNKVLKTYQTSVFKLMWIHFLLYLTASYCAQAIYLFLLKEAAQTLVESLRDLVVISKVDDQVVIMLLSFYIVKMVDRFAEACRLVRFPDELLVLIATAVPGYTRLRRTLKSNITRYVLASYILTLNKISNSVKRKFPDLSTMVNAGVLTTHEASVLRAFEPKRMEYRQPLDWAGKLVIRGRSDNVMGQGAVNMLVNGLAAQTDAMSQLLAHDRVGMPPQYTTAVHILIFAYNISSFIHHVIPEKKVGMAEPLGFILNPVLAALLFACHHGIIQVAKIINRPFRLNYDYLGLDRLVDDHIEEVSDCFRKMLAEVRDFEIDEWYDKALADEVKRDNATPETDSALEEQIDDIYERIRPVGDGLGTGPNDANDRHVPKRLSAEEQKLHAVIKRSPGVTPSTSEELAQESTHSMRATLLLELKQRQKGMQEIDEKLGGLKDANQQCDGMLTGKAFKPENVGENDHYVDIDEILLQMQETHPAIKCEICCKFCLTDEKVRELEEKTNGFEDTRKYRRLQCKCPNGVWI